MLSRFTAAAAFALALALPLALAVVVVVIAAAPHRRTRFVASCRPVSFVPRNHQCLWCREALRVRRMRLFKKRAPGEQPKRTASVGSALLARATSGVDSTAAAAAVAASLLADPAASRSAPTVTTRSRTEQFVAMRAAMRSAEQNQFDRVVTRYQLVRRSSTNSNSKSRSSSRRCDSDEARARDRRAMAAMVD